MIDDDDTRDRHLREALRHAPDAGLQPPAALSARILDEARAKARDARPVTADAPPWVQRVWAWLARPAVATGFAGVLAATLVGVMWWDQPMDEALPHRPVAAGARSTESAAPAAPPVAMSTPPPPAPAPAAEPAPPQRAPAPALQAPRKTAADKPAPAREEKAREVAPVPAPLTAPTPAPAPAPKAGVADNAGATAAASLARARSADETKRTEAEPAPALAHLRSSLVAEPARWGWQRDGDTPQALHEVNGALRDWLAQLDAAAAGRWQPVDAASLRAGREIAVLRDGQVLHRFRFLDDGLAWQGPQGGWQRVTLPPASLRALAASAP